MIKAKRSLGQNFIINKNLVKKMVEIVLEGDSKYLLEIGPGKGSFTLLFLEALGEKNVLLIEKDDELSEKWQSFYPNIKILNQDVLTVNVNLQLQKKLGVDFQGDEVRNKVVGFGSLPFNISKRIIKKMLVESDIKTHYYVVQKEVAEDYLLYTPTKKDESTPLGITTKYYADVKKILDISPGSFRPIPKVTSSFIRLDKNNENLTVEGFKKFEDFIYTCFRHPRKTLKNNLKDTKYFIESLFDLNKIRPGKLGFEDYMKLYKKLG